jgi:hypothetical protein
VLSILRNIDGDGPPRGVQRETALKAIALLQDRFGLPVDAIRFVGAGSPRAPPRSGPDQAGLINELRKWRGLKLASLGSRTSADLGAASRWMKKEPKEMGEPDVIRPLDGGTSPNAARSIDPAVLTSLRPAVIDLWGGRLSQGGVFKTSVEGIDKIFDVELPNRVRQLGRDKSLPIVLYARRTR